ncbi:hypothetical protein CDL15_Pgr010712 [Punica granatum]|uniref:Uncharacterized protein n=1 Tax=Punica granatum TaxID=22663 RepID=A0A218WNW6_PUNGR|nr:hypothetical protein CDL15_Pgr010712 [Punica granatum]PKI67255.1 hypothetical protein CRG98_012361 [Punica granatum]
MTNDKSGRVSEASRLSYDTLDLSRAPFLTGPSGPDPLTRLPEERSSGSERLSANLRGTFTESKDHSDPRTPQDIRETLRKPSHKSPGLPGPTVFGRGRRINDPTRGKRVTEMNIKMHKEQSGNGDTQLHSERPNRAKPTLEAPNHPNIRSHDIWRY